MLLDHRGWPEPSQTCPDLCEISHSEAGKAAAANVNNQTNAFI
jgi:hypothetical protein